MARHLRDCGLSEANPISQCDQVQLAPRIDGLTWAATKAQWPLMGTITWVYAVLAIVLAAMAVLAFDAISKIEEPRHHP